MPLVGKDWTQSGVASLFSAIKVCNFLLEKGDSMVLIRVI